MEPEETDKPNFRRKNQEIVEPDTEISNSIRHWLVLYRSRVYALCYPIEQPSNPAQAHQGMALDIIQ